MLAASELGPTALVLLDARAARRAARRCGAAGRPPLPTVLVAFDGLARAVAWQGEETGPAAPRGRGAAPSTCSTPAGRRARSRRCARRAGCFRSRSRSRPSACCPPALGAYLGAAPNDGRGRGLRARRGRAGGARAGDAGPRARRRAAPGRRTAAVLAAWREAARARGGHLAVEWAPLGVREACPVWDPPGPGVALMRGLKARLDPQGVLNPGRFVGGI